MATRDDGTVLPSPVSNDGGSGEPCPQHYGIQRNSQCQRETFNDQQHRGPDADPDRPPAMDQSVPKAQTSFIPPASYFQNKPCHDQLAIWESRYAPPYAGDAELARSMTVLRAACIPLDPEPYAPIRDPVYLMAHQILCLAASQPEQIPPHVRALPGFDQLCLAMARKALPDSAVRPVYLQFFGSFPCLWGLPDRQTQDINIQTHVMTAINGLQANYAPLARLCTERRLPPTADELATYITPYSGTIQWFVFETIFQIHFEPIWRGKFARASDAFRRSQQVYFQRMSLPEGQSGFLPPPAPPNEVYSDCLKDLSHATPPQTSLSTIEHAARQSNHGLGQTPSASPPLAPHQGPATLVDQGRIAPASFTPTGAPSLTPPSNNQGTFSAFTFRRVVPQATSSATQRNGDSTSSTQPASVELASTQSASVELQQSTQPKTTQSLPTRPTTTQPARSTVDAETELSASSPLVSTQSGPVTRIMPIITANGRALYRPRSPLEPASNTSASTAARQARTEVSRPMNYTELRRQAAEERLAHGLEPTTKKGRPFGWRKSMQKNTAPPVKRTPVFLRPDKHAIRLSIPEPSRYALHQAQLESPILAMMELAHAPSEQRWYQYIAHVVYPMPRPINVETCVESYPLSFPDNLIESIPEVLIDDEKIRWRLLNDRSSTFRLRCIKGDIPDAQQSWIITETSWPLNVYFSINGTRLGPRRKLQHGKDLPIDITRIIGARHITDDHHTFHVVSNMRRDAYPEERYSVGVECIKLMRHDEIKQSCLARPLTIEDTKEILRSSSAGLDDNGNTKDDEVTVTNFKVNLLDPIRLNRIPDIPVRGPACMHRSCFDLESFLSSRTPSNASLRQPEIGEDYISAVDTWRCPLCGGDARPNVLLFDAYMDSVRVELEARGQLDKARAILVNVDGSWTVAPEDKPSAGQRMKREPRQSLEGSGTKKSSVASLTTDVEPDVIMLDSD